MREGFAVKWGKKMEEVHSTLSALFKDEAYEATVPVIPRP